MHSSGLPPTPPPLETGAIAWARHFLLQTRVGNLLLLAIAVKIGVTVASRVRPEAVPFASVAGFLANLALLALAVVGLVRLLAYLKRRLLWRVRRKLILSYLFVGFVPVVLLVTFFGVSGLMLVFHLSSYLVNGELGRLEDEFQVLANSTVAELEHAAPAGSALPADEATIARILARRAEVAERRFPKMTLTVVVPRAPGQPPAVFTAGAWGDRQPPGELPSWVLPEGFKGLVRETSSSPLLVRAAGRAGRGERAFAVVVDLPVDSTVGQRLEQSTSILVEANRLAFSLGIDRQTPDSNRLNMSEPLGSFLATYTVKGQQRTFLTWTAWTEYRHWDTGGVFLAGLPIHVNVGELYQKLALGGSQKLPIAQFFVLFLALIGGLFLIVELAALLMGLLLAKSITGSVHALFLGTKRVQEGDFGYRIRVLANDQLGELAESFNTMAGSIEDLLRQAAEKKRLDEELRIAREIQMSLLPRDAIEMPGLEVTALCLPAREVGGDYYDFIMLDAHRLAILIADVAGKGASAALYMAELKGLILALAKRYDSPKRLLVEANAIISETLDSRSFITITYAVVDVAARAVTYARAGHSPIMYLPGPTPSFGAGTAEALGEAPGARLLTPSGIGLGIDRSGTFDRLLQEETVMLTDGDIFVFFTDGITEAMNERAELFGDARLREVIEANGRQNAAALRETILRAVEGFVGGAAQQDDMTMILLKVGSLAGMAAEAAGAAVTRV